MLGSEEIPSTQDHNNFVTNVAMSKMTSEKQFTLCAKSLVHDET